jgi:hypothetical protein
MWSETFSGIVSGTTSSLIVARLMDDLSSESILLQLSVSAIVTGCMIGGKAVGKTPRDQ